MRFSVSPISPASRGCSSQTPIHPHPKRKLWQSHRVNNPTLHENHSFEDVLLVKLLRLDLDYHYIPMISSSFAKKTVH